MKQLLLFFIAITAPIFMLGQPVEEIKKVLANDGTSGDLFGISVDISGDYAIVGAYFDNGSGWSESGSAYIFKKNEGGENNWQQIKKLVASDAYVDDKFGVSVAIDGDIAVVGSWLDDDNGNSDAGAIYVFYKDEGGTDNWGQFKKITPLSAHDYDQFGASVDISGNTIVAGANRKDYLGFKYGSVYIFDKDEGGTDNWGEVDMVYSAYPNDGDNFGWSVAIDGDNLIGGAKFDDRIASNAGSASIYNRNQGGTNNWGFVAFITGDDIVANDEFGYDVAISGETAIVGAHKHTISGGTDGEGAVYVFEKDAVGTDNWGQTNKLTDPNPRLDEWFGYGVAINENTIIVGAEQDQYNNIRYGAAHIFEHNGTSWEYADSIRASDGASYDRFGGAVAYDGQYAFISARYDDDEGTSSGSAYIFGPPAPEITLQPAALTNLCPESSYQLTIDGNYIEQYQWQHSTNGGTNFSDITNDAVYSGTQTAELTVNFDTDLDGYLYRCIVSNVRTTDTTNAVTIEKDGIIPTLTVQDITMDLDINGEARPQASAIVTAASDNCSIMDTILSQLLFTCEHVGPNTVDVSVLDHAGNLTMQQTIITIEDNTPPEFTVNDIVLELDESGTAQVDKSAIFSDVYDNCTVTDSILTQIYFNCGDIGTHTVTAYMYDGYNYSPSQDFTVTVEDNLSPEVTVQNTTIVLDAAGNASIAADDMITAASDNCGVADTVISQTIFDCSHLGENNVDITVTDVNGNENIQTIIVTVTDSEVPVLTTQNFSLELDENGEAMLNKTDVVVSATDNCNLDTTLSQVLFTCADIGINIIDVTVTDTYGNVVTETADITVEDLLAPELITQNITIELDDNSYAEITPEMVVISASDNCGVTDTTLSLSSFYTGDIGDVAIDVTATDGSGNNTIIPITVTVLENIPPEIVTQSIDVYLDETGNSFVATADVVVSITDNLEVADTSLSQHAFSCASIGENTIVVTATDVAGNIAQASAVVNVIDSIAPVPDIANLPDIYESCSATITTIPTSIDNCSGIIEAITTDPLAYTDQGTYTIEWMHTDDQGNAFIQTQNVTISDDIAPTFDCPENQYLEIADSEAGYTVTGAELDPINLADNCEVNEITNNINNTATLDDELLEPGLHTIQWTISDINGNETTCTFDVEISTVGIDETNHLVNIYPNPTDGKFNITNAAGANITITNATGKTVHRQTLHSENELINLSNIPAGIYMLHLNSSESNLNKKIIIK